MTNPDLNGRAELIADLRAFANLLERRHDIPIHNDGSGAMTLQYSIIGGDEDERRGRIHAIAARLGVDVDEDARRIQAVLDLGSIEYKVFAFTDFGDAAYAAESSYRGAVEPDMAGAR